MISKRETRQGLIYAYKDLDWLAMKTYYIIVSIRAIADLVKPGELTEDWTITRINVPQYYRSKGFGSKLLKEICNDADKEQVKLQLEPIPTGGLSYQELLSWYSRYGFKMNSYGYMIREPTHD